MTDTKIDLFNPLTTKEQLNKMISEDAGFIRPVAYFFLLALPKIEEKTKGGIILSQESIDMSSVGNNVGRIIGIGKGIACGKGGAFDDLMDLTIGDYVGYNPHLGIPRNFDNQIFLNIGDDGIRDIVPDITRVTDGIFKTYNVRGVN